MTLLYSNVVAGSPGAHVLAIGVGAYPHLIGGNKTLAAKPLGLDQISSPSASAKAFIDWCLAPLLDNSKPGFRNQKRPLASLEALISSDADVSITSPGGTVKPEPATRANIQAAFKRWLDLVGAHDDNIGVFYFCGHGVMVADHYLLAEDFGDSALLPWDNAFNMSQTLRAIERQAKGSIYVLVDACRAIARDVALTLGADPRALAACDLTKSVVCRSKSLIEATGEGKLAFGADGEVSRFTQSLLTALSGYCGVRTGGSLTWDVDGETLAGAVRKLLEDGNRGTDHPQVSDQTISGSLVPMITIDTAPKVKARVDLSPTEKREVATFTLTSGRGARFEAEGAKGAFSEDIPRGLYQIVVTPAAGEFNTLTHEDQDVMPPLFELTMSV